MRSWIAGGLLTLLVLSSCMGLNRKSTLPQWAQTVDQRIHTQIKKSFHGDFGVYIKNLKTGQEYTYQADQAWYLSSTTKVPIAVTLLQWVDRGELNLKEKVTITKNDYRDGAGPVNWLKPGSRVSYHYLLRQMLIYSDNAATDLILKKVGLDAVNRLTQSIDSEFGPITSLLDVRYKAYGKFHPKVAELSNIAFLRIKKQKGSQKRLKQLSKELMIPLSEFQYPTVTQGFNRYYSEGWNTATLRAYSRFLEKLHQGQLLSAKSTQRLLRLMQGTQTGQKRIKRGLSLGYHFAHKTGTQHKQACDAGILSHAQTSQELVIMVCSRNWKKLADAEKIMAQISASLVSGLKKSPSQTKNN
jgi:beta-lactamase class A